MRPSSTVPSSVRESDLLSHIYTRSRGLSAAFGHVIIGPGDDCAVIATPSGDRLLLKVDQLVSGRHFRPIPRTPIDLIARKAVARAVSDIAAMGGSPTCALAAATLPAGFLHADDLFDAMARWAIHWDCPLVGGDIAVAGDADGAMVLGVTVLGAPAPVRGPVLRSGAAAGDAVYVTGALGGSFNPTTGLGRHLTFEPRLVEARWLCDTFGDRLHAMMDISDGLGRDAARLAAASQAAIELDAALLPLASGVTSWRQAAADGEDYELLFTAPADAGLPLACPLTGTPITRIGRITPASRGATRCVILTPGGPEAADEMGWDHGRADRPPSASE
jgi:thiamine-monophosphate kinase